MKILEEISVSCNVTDENTNIELGVCGLLVSLDASLVSFVSPMLRLAWLLFILLPVLSLAPGCDLLGDRENNEQCAVAQKSSDQTAEIEFAGTLVFSSAEGGPNQIYTMNANGTNHRQLTTDLDSTRREEEAFDPSFSPDGTQIVFSTTRNATTAGLSLYLMDRDGSDVRPLKRFKNPPPRVLIGSHPTWSPDGEKIASYFCTNCEAGGANYEIRVVDVVGNETVSEGRRLTDHPARDRHPTWGPEGKRIAFVSNRAYLGTEDERRQDLYVMDIDGSNIRRLTRTGIVGAQVAWSGSKIAYGLENEEGRIAIFDMSCSKSEFLDVDLQEEMKLFPVKWSPNGRALLISVLDYPNYSLHFLDTKTGQTRRIPFGPALLRGIDWLVEPSN